MSYQDNKWSCLAVKRIIPEPAAQRAVRGY
jgi:hypothetical protein